MKSFLPLAFTFSHVFYFFLIFNVSVMQLRAIATWRFIESSTEKKKRSDEGGDEGWLWLPLTIFFTSLSCFVSTSYLVQIESTSVGSKHDVALVERHRLSHVLRSEKHLRVWLRVRLLPHGVKCSKLLPLKS